MKLTDSISVIKGVGIENAKKFKVLGIHNIYDLINTYPKRYEDYSQISQINKIHPGPVTIKATINNATGKYVSRGLHVTEAIASDSSGSVRIVWFNQPYRASSIKRDNEYYISGEFTFAKQRLSIQNPSAELVSSFPVNTARIIPIYKETKGFKSAQIRKAMREIMPLIDDLNETLPDWIVRNESLLARSDALKEIHFPTSSHSLSMAQKRIGFEEVFELMLASLLNKKDLQQEVALQIPFDETLAKKFVKHLEFTLTDDQKRVVWQIYQDMQKKSPMNRLVEGDVGSGKTVVAVMSAIMAIAQGFQVAFMAPTEILARQHADTIMKLLKPLGIDDKVGLLVGSLPPRNKALAHKDIKNGKLRFIIGTHALIAEKVDMHKLGLIIIDEQHRFGVDQRKKLEAKTGHAVHVISMSATPIPRSLALTLYGELDISIIATKPTNRKVIKTEILPLVGRDELYKKIDTEIDSGRQAFVVCPLISESDIMPAKSAEQVYEELKIKYFKHRNIGLLHGKMKPNEKDKIMSNFASGDLDIIVCTTVIEVGVDVPNASVMVIENAERFGLAQIHQLRGRVGRSDKQGYCYLVLGDNQKPSMRLNALKSSTDGFKLAEYDLQLRGPGAIYGSMQHGQLDLRMAKLSNIRLIKNARDCAQKFIDNGESLQKYPTLYANVKKNQAVTNLN